jgi:hypothetical protein
LWKGPLAASSSRSLWISWHQSIEFLKPILNNHKIQAAEIRIRVLLTHFSQNEKPLPIVCNIVAGRSSYIMMYALGYDASWFCDEG